MTIAEPGVELDITPLSPTIGATIQGVDLRHLDDDAVAAIRRAWLQHKVVFFPGQHLNPTEHLAFARRFGATTEGHPVIPGLEDNPEIFEIDYTRAKAAYGDVATTSRGISWHTDVTYVRRPPMGSILNAVVMPAAGGDTCFSDQQAALEGLSPTLQAFLGTLTAVHDGRSQFQSILDHVKEGRWDGEAVLDLTPNEHPVVRTHPETGHRSLFVNPGFTSHLKGLTRGESSALLAFLYAHSVQPEYVVRYHWTAGDVGFWDNRCTQHMVVGDFAEHRVIQRVTLRGDTPV